MKGARKALGAASHAKVWGVKEPQCRGAPAELGTAHAYHLGKSSPLQRPGSCANEIYLHLLMLLSAAVSSPLSEGVGPTSKDL